MKRIITVLALMLGVTFTAHAQQNQQTKPATTTATNPEAKIQQAAIEDVKALNEAVKLDNTQMQDLKGLFENKHRNLAANLSDERKKLLAQTIEAKLNATLTAEQTAKLNAKPELLKRLTM
jgi:hypothetical protein